jgi:hypothetical protein
MALSTKVRGMLEESKGNASLCVLRADSILCVDRNVLYCSLHYSVIHYTVLLCIALYCTEQYYSTLPYTAMHCAVLRCAEQHHPTLPYPALPCTALIALYLCSPCRQAAFRSAPKGVSLSFSSSFINRDSCCHKVTLTRAQDHLELYGISMGNPFSSTHRDREGEGPGPGVGPEGVSVSPSLFALYVMRLCSITSLESKVSDLGITYAAMVRLSLRAPTLSDSFRNLQMLCPEGFISMRTTSLAGPRTLPPLLLLLEEGEEEVMCSDISALTAPTLSSRSTCAIGLGARTGRKATVNEGK